MATLHFKFFATLFVALLGLALSQPASAQDREETRDPIEQLAANSTFDMHDEVAADFSRFELQTKTQVGLDILVRQGLEALRNHGHQSLANELEVQWQQERQRLASQINIFDLGDHRPLSRWLARFDEILRSKLGDQVMGMLNLDDVNDLNYAIPVVFQPRGDRRNQDRWDQAEYRNHFVPFATIVTYWTSLFACKYATRAYPQYGRFCSLAAAIARNGMKVAIAPKLSDNIYNAANGLPRSSEQILADLDLEAARARYNAEFSLLP